MKPATAPETHRVVARVESEAVGWLLAAVLPTALLRHEPSVLHAGVVDDRSWLRDMSASGVEPVGLGLHVIRDALEALSPITREAESLAGLLRATPEEALKRALSQLSVPEA